MYLVDSARSPVLVLLYAFEVLGGYERESAVPGITSLEMMPQVTT